MVILSEKQIIEFLSKRDYDIQKSHNARWIDQKCTPDVVCIVADCIVNYIADKGNIPFTSRDIWFSDFSIQNVLSIFKKADVTSESTKSEYDKFFQQPMKMLAYAGILSETKKGLENIFKVENLDLIQHISLAEKYSLTFLQLYIEKVLSDSGIYDNFKTFFKNSNKTGFEDIKELFYTFTITNTPIGSRVSKTSIERPGYKECGRIFTKIINPLAFKNNSFGTEKGHLSRKKVTYDMLMYNRDNFRDIYSEKPKEMARKDYEEAIKFMPNNALIKYQSVKAKKFIRLYNQQYRNSITELLEDDEFNVNATQVHHIFSESDFPVISMFYENLINLTPNQHFVRAHPNNKTSAIDKHYQYQCLIAKSDRIKENIESQIIETIYSFVKFLYVINIGLSDESYLQVDESDYSGLKTKLTLSYSA
ncbi:MAG: restriction endonuclease [Clostridia bacterium]|nr:restriction endonuclease [Clostridia bacterium]